eukprot:GDKI01039604.1.p1 GENE.GDKI01039604.1~~GDKI01039604.1.p1  ORF type:complete len:500 (-),score=141.73 GDKI01039604.1:66-1481(-)
MTDEQTHVTKPSFPSPGFKAAAAAALAPLAPIEKDDAGKRTKANSKLHRNPLLLPLIFTCTLLVGLTMLVVRQVLLLGPATVSDHSFKSAVPTADPSDHVAASDLQQDFLSKQQGVVQEISTHLRAVEQLAAHTPLQLSIDPYTQKKFAYVFYATNDQYACNALVMAGSLRDQHVHPAIKIVVLHTDGVSQNMQRRFEKNGLEAIHVDMLRGATSGVTWIDSYAKLRVFNLPQYDRIIYLDSDALVAHNLDHFFLLPDHFLYAPRAYWIAQPFMNSQMLIVQYNKDVWDEINKELSASMADQAKYAGEMNFNGDMDLINHLYKDTAGLLPGVYETLNGDWSWDHFAKGDTKFDFTTLDQLASKTFVVHFSESPTRGYGKPWSSGRQVANPTATHPFFREVFDRWWAYSDRFCTAETETETENVPVKGQHLAVSAVLNDKRATGVGGSSGSGGSALALRGSLQTRNQMVAGN